MSPLSNEVERKQTTLFYVKIFLKNALVAVVVKVIEYRVTNATVNDENEFFDENG